MKKLYLIVLSLVTFLGATLLPISALAAASIAPSGGSSVTAGSTISVRIIASGATFNAFSGTIGVSGNISVTGVSYDNSLIWIGTPGANKTFNGALAGNKTVSSLTIATLTVKGNSQGSGKITVSGAQLSNESAISAGGGTLNITVNRAPTVPGEVAVTSSTNPDQNQSYGVTTVQLAWAAPTNGATGYSVAFDQTADTNPPETVSTTNTSASYSDLNLGTYYFHIKAHNNDGWGPVTHFKVNVSAAVDATLKAPKITSVTKLKGFKNDVVNGTVSNFRISGTSTNLSGFTVTLAFTPSSTIPAEQKLDAVIKSDGTWSVDFNQPIPAGFYKVTATALKDKVAAPASQPLNIELSVANGGTAKIITQADLPQPKLAITVAGITFSDKSHLWWLIGFIIIFAGVVLAIAYGIRQLFKKYYHRRSERVGKPDMRPPKVL